MPQREKKLHKSKCAQETVDIMATDKKQPVKDGCVQKGMH